MTTTHDLIAQLHALPRTHACVTVYADGAERRVPAVSASAAENHAVMVRRQIGKDLIERGTGKTVRVVRVYIEKIA